MNKKTGLIIGVVVLVLISFYCGMQYGGNNVRASLASKSQNSFGGNRMMGGAGSGRGMRNGGGFVNGEILSQDAQSITLKLQNSGSQIVFFNSQTKVSKMVDGAMTDLATGKTISVTGTPNPDGSVTATSIQLRPAFTNPTSQVKQ